MLTAVPKEVKNHKYRVGLTPTSVREAVYHGHKAVLESHAGAAISPGDEDYASAGAEIVPAAAS
jgi:alanine dehydrogenase